MSVTGIVSRSEGASYLQPGRVDPRNASYEEIQAYNEYLVGKGYLELEDIDSFENVVEDNKKKADYYSALQDWANTQYRIGNIAGYNKAAKINEAWINDIEEQDGTATYLDGNRVWNMNAYTHTTSGLLGFGSFEDGMNFSARYADSSTDENPVVQVRMTNETGTEIIVNVDIKQVDPENATQLEMFAFLAHLDAQGTSGNDKMMGSYEDLLYRAQNSTYGDARAKDTQDFMFQHKDWRSMALDMTEFGSAAQALAREYDGVPYSYLAKDGIIDYKGVIFVCDTERNALCLGNTSDMSKCLRIPLSRGGSLIVNRDNLGDLATAIGMFSPEDVNRILRAIAEDAKVQQMKQQIDDETSGLNLAENTGESADTGEGQETQDDDKNILI